MKKEILVVEDFEGEEEAECFEVVEKGKGVQ